MAEVEEQVLGMVVAVAVAGQVLVTTEWRRLTYQ